MLDSYVVYRQLTNAYDIELMKKNLNIPRKKDCNFEVNDSQQQRKPHKRDILS